MAFTQEEVEAAETAGLALEYQHNLTGAEVLSMVGAAAVIMAGNLENKSDLESKKSAADRIQIAIWNFAASQLRAFANAARGFPLTETRVAVDGVIPFEDMSPDEKEATIHAAGYEQGYSYGHGLGFEEGVRVEQLRHEPLGEALVNGAVAVVEPGSESDPFSVGTPAWEATVLDDGEENAPITTDEAALLTMAIWPPEAGRIFPEVRSEADMPIDGPVGAHLVADVSNADMPVLDTETQEISFQKDVDEAEIPV